MIYLITKMTYDAKDIIHILNYFVPFEPRAKWFVYPIAVLISLPLPLAPSRKNQQLDDVNIQNKTKQQQKHR